MAYTASGAQLHRFSGAALVNCEGHSFAALSPDRGSDRHRLLGSVLHMLGLLDHPP